MSEDTNFSLYTPSESGYADVNGVKMYYEVYGEGKPVVLLHGSFMNIPRNWGQVIPILAKDRKVIAAEMQGHGRTRDLSRDISFEVMAEDVYGLLRHLKTESADIIGYSMGGGIAFRLTIQHPELVRRLVVLSCTYAKNGWLPEAGDIFVTITPEMFIGSPVQKQYDGFGNDPARFPEFVKKVMSIHLTPYDWSIDVKNIRSPLFMAIGDAEGIRYEHVIELFRSLGGGKMGDMHGVSETRLAIIPGTTHLGMIQRLNWLLPVITDFLDFNQSSATPV